MAGPTIQGSQLTNQWRNSSSTYSVPLPSGVTASELVLIFCHLDWASGQLGPTSSQFPSASGWTFVAGDYTGSSSGGGAVIHLLWKIVGAGETSATVSWYTDPSGVVTRYFTAIRTNAIAVDTVSAKAQNRASSLSLSALTTHQPNELLVGAFAANTGGSTPSGMTFDAISLNTITAYAQQAAAGTSIAPTYTSSGVGYAGMIVSLQGITEVDLTISSTGASSATGTLISAAQVPTVSAGVSSAIAPLRSPARILPSSTGVASANGVVQGAPDLPMDSQGTAAVAIPVSTKILLAAAANGIAIPSIRVTSPVFYTMVSVGGSSTLMIIYTLSAREVGPEFAAGYFLSGKSFGGGFLT